MSALSDNTLRTGPFEERHEPVESRPDLTALRRLQNVRGFPAVSILLSTTPAEQMTDSDAARLAALTARATDRLRVEAAGTAPGLVPRLRSIAERAAAGPTDKGLALYVHNTHTEVVRLPQPVADRVVVAETFAAGDLVTAFRHAPHYLLLLLGVSAARLYDGHGRRLREHGSEAFRTVNPWRGASNLRSVGWDVEASLAWAARQRAYLQRVDTAIDAVAPYETVPRVLAGEPSLCATYLDVTLHPERVVGSVRCDDVGSGVDALERLAGRLIDRHVLRLERQALAALAEADAAGRLVSGVGAVWPAAVRGEGATLLLEEGMARPARISSDGLGLTPAVPDGGRGVVADIIGELAGAVAFFGGDVVVLPRGVLSAHDGVALILRR